LLALALLLVVGPASANLITVGDAWVTDSWKQQFTLSGAAFDSIQVQMDSTSYPPDQFQAAVFSLFSVGGWTNVPIVETPLLHGLAQGGLTSTLQFSVQFAPNWNEPLDFTMRAFNGPINGTNEVFYTEASWTPDLTQWPGPTPQGNWTFVPEPISMVMLGCLGAGMAAARRLRRKV